MTLLLTLMVQQRLLMMDVSVASEERRMLVLTQHRGP